VPMHGAAGDPEGQARFRAFLLGLQQLGWTDGSNLRIDTRWTNVILASSTLSTVALQNATSTVPIVFANVTDPVGAGFVDSPERPGGNVTGFMPFEYSISGKWLELLKEIAPRVTHVAVIRDPASPAAIGQFAVIRSVAQQLGVELSPVAARDAQEIERALATFLRSPNGGLAR
jgi:ABC-type uncharacterized transport system substrate-binding protein